LFNSGLWENPGDILIGSNLKFVVSAKNLDLTIWLEVKIDARGLQLIYTNYVTRRQKLDHTSVFAKIIEVGVMALEKT
jgi:hypothetical protein